MSGAGTPDIFYRSFPCSLDNRNLLLRQPLQLVHQRINRCIRRLDLPLEQRPFVIELGVLQFFVQVEHLCDKRDHAITFTLPTLGIF
jgi:hypothetical protein